MFIRKEHHILPAEYTAKVLSSSWGRVQQNVIWECLAVARVMGFILFAFSQRLGLVSPLCCIPFLLTTASAVHVGSLDHNGPNFCFVSRRTLPNVGREVTLGQPSRQKHCPKTLPKN
jgi:hypothetical protein